MNLREFQQRFAQSLMAPPTATRKLNAEARLLIPHSARLTSLERLAIYRRSYWSRLLDNLSDDFSGLRAILGPSRFNRLATAYLLANPSRSYTLRDLGARMVQWLPTQPHLLGRDASRALDMARLEWAHIHAFDGPSAPTLDPEHLLLPTPRLRIGLQPYITLLDLEFPVDTFLLNLGENPPKPRPERTRLAIHRHNGTVYYRRLTSEEYQLLTAIQRGGTLASVLVSANASATQLQQWFALWAELGWLTSPTRKTKGSTRS
jgi:hypothetical protein